MGLESLAWCQTHQSGVHSLDGFNPKSNVINVIFMTLGCIGVRLLFLVENIVALRFKLEYRNEVVMHMSWLWQSTTRNWFNGRGYNVKISTLLLDKYTNA